MIPNIVCIISNSIQHLPFVYCQLNDQTVLIKIIQVRLFCFMSPIDRTLSGATPPGQSGPGNDGNEKILPIPQTFSITESNSQIV